eukprot:scaffold39812_cov74-Phaeocystis_antarctica.AAC.2
MGRPPVRIGLEAIHTSLVCVSEHKGTATWSSVAASRDLPMRARQSGVQVDRVAHGGRRPSLRPPRQQRGGAAGTGSLERVAAFSGRGVSSHERLLMRGRFAWGGRLAVRQAVCCAHSAC